VNKNEPVAEQWAESTLLERGWTKRLIAELLVKHDDYTSHDGYLYSRDRVEEAEQGRTFKDSLARRTPKPTFIDYRTLRARKAYLGLRNEDLMRATGCSPRTVSAFLAGNEKMNLEKIVVLAAELGLKPRVTFELLEGDGEESKTT
jgi:hypothetical protein